MGKKLYVGNLAYSMTNEGLSTLFSAHGSVDSAQVIMDRETGRSKGFGFVEMGNAQEADAAIAALVQAMGGEALIEAVRAEQPLCSLLIIDPLSVVTAGIFDEAKLRSVARGLATSVADWMVALTVETERLALQPGLERILGEVCGALLELSQEAPNLEEVFLRLIRDGRSAAGGDAP